MFRFNTILIDPTSDALSKALAEACAAANAGCRSRLLSWPTDDFADFVASWRATPEGQHQWNGPGKFRKKGPGGDTRSAAAVVWWTDPLSHRHCRIVGDRVNCGCELEDDLFQPDSNPRRPARERPPLWHVYPDDLYLREQNEEWHLWAVCRCGACGPPEKLGWMGPWCAACHDRAEEGAPLSRPGVCPPVVFPDHWFWVVNVAFGLGGSTLLTRITSSNHVDIWDTATAEMPTPRGFPHDYGRGHALAVTADGRIGAICIEEKVYVWSLESDSDLRTLSLPDDELYDSDAALAFSHDGKSLAYVGGRSLAPVVYLAIYEVATGKRRWKVSLKRWELLRNAQCLAFTPDDHILAVGEREETISLWDAETGDRLPNLPDGFPSGSAVAFSPNGKTLATGADFYHENNLSIWDMESRTLRASFPGPIAGLAFSPDGRILATVGRDGCLRLRDGHDGKLLAAYRWHQSDINAVAYSPDGRWLATGANEDRVKLWPVEGLLGDQKRKKKQ